jgi:hypothetical protein
MDEQRDERNRSVPFALRVAFQEPSHVDWRDATQIKAFVLDYLFAVQEALLDDLEVAARDIENVSASPVAADGGVASNREHGVVGVLRAVTETREITKYYKAIIAVRSQSLCFLRPGVVRDARLYDRTVNFRQTSKKPPASTNRSAASGPQPGWKARNRAERGIRRAWQSCCNRPSNKVDEIGD